MTLEEILIEIRKKVNKNAKIKLVYPNSFQKELVMNLFKEYGEYGSTILENNPVYISNISLHDWEEILLSLENNEFGLKAALRFLYLYLKIHSVEIFLSLDANEISKGKITRFFNKYQNAFFSSLSTFKVDDSLIQIGLNLIKQGAPPAIHFDAILEKVE
ncbi:MAG: hypothetical protein ACO1N0_19425 [Fluviicola sp.]